LCGDRSDRAAPAPGAADPRAPGAPGDRLRQRFTAAAVGLSIGADQPALAGARALGGVPVQGHPLDIAFRPSLAALIRRDTPSACLVGLRSVWASAAARTRRGG